MSERLFLNKIVFDKLKGNVGVRQIAKDIGSTYTIFKNAIYHNQDVSIEFCQKLSSYLNVEIDELFTREPIIYSKEMTQDIEISEKMIVGLKSNISKRLEVCHTKPYVDAIMELVDQLIIESSYLGVIAEKRKVSSFIESAIIRKVMDRL